MLAAVVRGDPHEVRSYIEAEGFDVNDAAAGSHGNTPLMVACAPSERLRVLALLLERTDLARGHGSTPRHATPGATRAPAALLACAWDQAARRQQARDARWATRPPPAGETATRWRDGRRPLASTAAARRKTRWQSTREAAPAGDGRGAHWRAADAWD